MTLEIGHQLQTGGIRVADHADWEAVRKLTHEAWCDGYHRAVRAMRAWAEQFANEDTKTAVLTAADMIEEAINVAKPPEMR